MIRHRVVWLSPFLLGLALTSCERGSPTGDADFSASSEDLTFVTMAPNAPPLETQDTSFWAVRGQDREIQIRYESPTYGYAKCMRFVVPADALPAGVAPGDSVQISVHVVDPKYFEFQFEPSGLRFDPEHPAHLEIRYTVADPDLNHDGVVDARDTDLASRLAIWRQERRGEPWYRLETALEGDALEARADVQGFTILLLASN